MRSLDSFPAEETVIDASHKLGIRSAQPISHLSCQLLVQKTVFSSVLHHLTSVYIFLHGHIQLKLQIFTKSMFRNA